ncbi:MAG TPA: MazG family protein [Mycobacteriales bacterium]|nr:MazG family protein [Mycobacteriales bacterium]
MDRLVLIANTHRVAPGLLSWSAWEELQRGPVFTRDAEHPQLPFLEMAGVGISVLRAEDGPQDQRVSYLLGGGDSGQTALAWQFRERARGGQAVWLASHGGDPDFVRALGDIAAREGGVELEVVYGSYDMPGARLLDLVATMDRLRSPGGCPWDAEQTHESLAPYLVEETYEALDALESGDLDALRDELGDVLLQVVFHARVAQERDDESGWSIDDVAGRIVEKLVRRHPHVFGDVEVSGAAEVLTNWEELKAAERADDAGPFDHVPMGQPALTLAATLQRKAAKAGVRADVPDGPGGELWALVDRLRLAGLDPEAELRAASRSFRDAAR